MKRILCLLSLTLLFSTQIFAAAFPYQTVGRSIVDAEGRPVHLKAVNWYGANLEAQVAHGLEHKSLDAIASMIKELGYNSVRLTYSNAMIHDQSPVKPELIRANPGLMGMSALEIFDKTVEALAAHDLAIMLNNHSSSSVWCCGYDTDGLWYHAGNSSGFKQSEEQWIADWKMLVERYQDIPQVVAADLRNEVRTAKWGDSILPLSPNWGSGDANDWARAAERAGNEVLAVNPNLLIIVEGINWTGTLSMFGGYRPHLMSVLDRPVQLNVPGRLVYAAHNYGYTGPKHNGDSKTSPGQITYGEMDDATFEKQMDLEWGYVVNRGMFYTAPLIVSEFGVSFDTTNERDRQWFRRIVDYMVKKKLHFAYWPLNPEGYGILEDGWKIRRGSDWRAGDFNRLLTIEAETIDKSSRFASVNIQQGNQALTQAFGDWAQGSDKGTCANDTRLIGLSRDYRGLCTDAARNSKWTGQSRPVVDHEEADEDWAGGFTKYTCPKGSFVVGYSKRFWGTNGVLCMKPEVSLSNSCRTVWFDRGDARGDTSGGDFARGSHKGQCRSDEYISGVAQRDGKASALRCCGY